MPDKPIDLYARPPWAAYVWCNATHIIVELPCPTGKAPVIVEYAKTEAGFAKALNLINQNANTIKAPPLPGHWKVYNDARAKPTYTRLGEPKLSDQPSTIRDAVARAARKAGL